MGYLYLQPGTQLLTSMKHQVWNVQPAGSWETAPATDGMLKYETSSILLGCIMYGKACWNCGVTSHISSYLHLVCWAPPQISKALTDHDTRTKFVHDRGVSLVGTDSPITWRCLLDKKSPSIFEISLPESSEFTAHEFCLCNIATRALRFSNKLMMQPHQQRSLQVSRSKRS